MWCVLVSTGRIYRVFSTPFGYNYIWRNGGVIREGGILDCINHDGMGDMEGYEEF